MTKFEFSYSFSIKNVSKAYPIYAEKLFTRKTAQKFGFGLMQNTALIYFYDIIEIRYIRPKWICI